MNDAALRAIRKVADDMLAGDCPVNVGDKVRTKGGGHYVVLAVAWNPVVGDHVLTVAADCPVKGVDKVTVRLPLACFAT